MNGAGEPDPGGGGYKRRYRALKRRLKFLIYEQECFQEELRKAQRKLLKVSRDKSFLLDHLLQYENVDEDSSEVGGVTLSDFIFPESDSEATASSDNSDGEMQKGTEPQSLKRKQIPQLGSASSPSSSGLSLQPTSGFGLPASGTSSPYLTSLNSPTYAPFPSDYLALGPEPVPPQPDSNATRSARRPARPHTLKVPQGRCEQEEKGIKKPQDSTSLSVFLSYSHLQLPLPTASHSDCSPVVVGLPFPSPRGTPKLPPPTILSTVPHQMFSDAGEGSGEDPLDGDDELVIDIPE
ncbi:hypothetical protein Chor_012771 [Crotalus horridus]